MKCINCGGAPCELHHVVPLALGGNDIPSNKVPLCSKCHALIHNLNADRRGTNWRNLQAAGIHKAKERGVKFGKPCSKKPDNWNDVISKWQAGEITAVKAMELTGMTKTTFYKYVKVWR